MKAAIFRLSDVTQPYLNMHKQNNYFLATHFNFVRIIIDSSVEIHVVDFQFAMELGIMLAFQNLQEVNEIFKMAAFVGLFDFRIAITFLFYIRF